MTTSVKVTLPNKKPIVYGNMYHSTVSGDTVYMLIKLPSKPNSPKSVYGILNLDTGVSRYFYKDEMLIPVEKGTIITIEEV